MAQFKPMLRAFDKQSYNAEVKKNRRKNKVV